jgi:gluconate kinase
MMKMTSKTNIFILFGEMGSGKNFWGERFAKDKGYLFFDGDTVVSPEMKERVSKFKPLTRRMVIDYIDHLTMEIVAKARASTGLVVAQALYFDKDRRFLKYVLSTLGFNVIFYWVRPTFWNNLKQIYSRPNGLRWVLYWLINKPFFQKPTHEYNEIFVLGNGKSFLGPTNEYRAGWGKQ